MAIVDKFYNYSIKLSHAEATALRLLLTDMSRMKTINPELEELEHLLDQVM